MLRSYVSATTLGWGIVVIIYADYPEYEFDYYVSIIFYGDL